MLRFAPHAPNFTPVAAIALFGGAYLKRGYALAVPLALMVISDIFIGMHDVVIFTWGAFVLTALLGLWIKKHKSALRTGCASLVSALLFYLVSNLGVWLVGWYPHSLDGLVRCYVMALPFLRNFTLATLIYAGVFFGVYEAVARLVKETKFSKVLLTN
jgi:hypothetical protein